MAHDDRLFVDLCAPSNESQLSLHAKKLMELKSWIKNAVKKKSNEVLLITGPTGVGKSTSVEVICKSLQVELITYQHENLYETEGYLEEECGTEDVCKFVRQCGAQLTGHRGFSILFIDNLPESVFKNVDGFRSQFLSSLCICRRPVIISLSDVESCWHLSPRRLFPVLFCKAVGIEILHFNPVAKTLMKKAIVQAAEKLNLKLKPQSIANLIESANGDVRVAVNMLQFNSTAKLTATGCNREEVFHMLGRILYAKRVEKSGKKGERPPLEKNVNEIIEMSSMGHEKVIDFLHEHELKFVSNLETMRKVTDVFSICDSMDSSWEVKKRIPDEYISQIAARAVMYWNYGNEKKSGLITFHKPLLHELTKFVQNLKEDSFRRPEMAVQQFSLTASYLNRIKNPPHSDIISYVTRPFNFSWRSGRDAWTNVPEKMTRPKKRPKLECEMDQQIDDVIIIEDSDDEKQVDSDESF